jgi:AraC family transcriptional regulator of adaptative response / DNA-3-methyladenine glycosylase II
MVVSDHIRPRGPYSLRVSGRLSSDATRRVRDGVVDAAFEVDGRLERARAWQLPDGAVELRAASEAGLALIRFPLAVDDDHSVFLARFGRDPLIGEATRRLRGLRPMRTATVAQALLRALAGQLIQSSRARAIEFSVVRAATPLVGDLHAAPTPASLARFAPAELRRFGLGARRAATLVRLCRSLDLERLRHVSDEAAAARLLRERGLGPWSVGVVALRGLGSYRIGLKRDLGLIKLCAALWGRHVEPEETDVLLEPYEEWAGLASVYLLHGFAAGLVPLSSRAAA